MNKKQKICPNCGITFKVERVNQKYCSEKCSKTAKSRQKAESYRRIYQSNIDEYISDEVYVSENKRITKPLIADVQETLSILKDFGVQIDSVPEFHTYSDLNSWKNKQINNMLS